MKRIDLFGRKYGNRLNKFQLFIDWLLNSLYIAFVLLLIGGFFIFVLYFIYKFITFYL